MSYEDATVELKRNHLYPEPLLSDAGEVSGLTISANPYTKDDRIFYLNTVLDKKEFKVFWDKKISRVVITKK